MEIKEIKKSSMRDIIFNFPHQFAKGLDSAEKVRIRGKFKNIIVCGMGGSAWPAEILRDWLTISFLYVNKNYRLPPQAGKESLIIIISYSGDTEEALSCYDEAKKRRLNTVCLTTGGKLAALCQKDKKPLVKMPGDVPAPRLGCGYTFSGLAAIISNANLIKNASKDLISMAKNLEVGRLEKKGKKLAKRINGKIPIIYISERLKTLAYIWKIKFNETSKIPAFYNCFPELNHNELSAYAKNNDGVFTIILRDKEEDKRILKRMTLTAEIIRSKNIPVEFVDLSGRNLLEKIFNSVVLADWTSYYLALRSHIDPIEVKIQNEFKKRLKK